MKLTWQGRYVLRNGHVITISRSIWDKDLMQILWLGRCDTLDQTITLWSNGTHRYGKTEYDIVREWTGNVIPANFSIEKRAWDIEQYRARQLQQKREAVRAEIRRLNKRILDKHI